MNDENSGSEIAAAASMSDIAFSQFLSLEETAKALRVSVNRQLKN